MPRKADIYISGSETGTKGKPSPDFINFVIFFLVYGTALTIWVKMFKVVAKKIKTLIFANTLIHGTCEC